MNHGISIISIMVAVKAKERHKVEAENNELKRRHGYHVAISSVLLGVEMQGTMTIFAVNLK